MTTTAPQVPDFLMRQQPPASFALFDDGKLLIKVGDTELLLPPSDIRRLDTFMGTFGGTP